MPNRYLTRRTFLAGAASAAAVASPTLRLAAAAVGGRPVRTPLLLDTKRMAVWDGPGLRTTFFVKGCPLRCVWCHTPESYVPEAQLARFVQRCRHCPVCTQDETTCPGGALKLYGRPQTFDDLVAKALADRDFYARTGGGVTVSGGEPLFFWEWTRELMARFKAAGLHTCLDTSLYAPPAAIEALMPVVDMWLPDYKAADDALHRRCTGVSNAVILRNLETLVRAGAPLEVRLLVVPGLTDGADLAARRAHLRGLGVADGAVVELEYHDLARSKFEALNLPDTMPRRN